MARRRHCPICNQLCEPRQTYCVECELGGKVWIGLGHSGTPTELRPLQYSYRLRCWLCTYEEWLTLTRQEAAELRLPRCRCGSAVFIEEDMGSLGSPREVVPSTAPWRIIPTRKKAS